MIRAELPGIDPGKDVDITVQDGVLLLRGERRHEERQEGNGGAFYRFESTYGAFERSVPLPEGVKADDVSAHYENGILEVVVPKAAELSAAKRIPIQVGQRRRALTTKGGRKT